MTYKDQFIAEVKCNGSILRVRDDIITLPFGSDYSLFFKNLSSKRASVKVSIDGQDVLYGNSLVIDGNTSTELLGFMNGSQVKNKFLFIQKTKEVQEYRGDKIDDGIIRIEFAYEKVKPVTFLTELKPPQFNWNYNEWFTGNSADKYNSKRSLTSDVNINSVTYSCSVGVNTPLLDEGITVKGGEIRQQYTYVTMGELEESSVIILKLKGVTLTNQPVQQAVTTSKKLICSSCGTKCKSLYKYCPNCGTYLE